MRSASSFERKLCRMRTLGEAESTSTVIGGWLSPSNELRVFVHYQPQFYHLHVHFTRAHVNPGCEAERAHLLTDIIQNLEGCDDYYVRRTLTHRLRENDPLLKALRPPE